MSTVPLPVPAPRLRAVSEIDPRPGDWLWPGRLALGQLAVLEGDPGLGKSFVALDLCARLSAGLPWPDGATAPAPAACVVLNGEDGAEDAIRPRLDALGADPAAPPSLPSQAEALEALVAGAQARLLVIDPILHFFDPGVNTGSDPAVRRALAPLAALARRRACGVLLVRHLTKVGRGRAISPGLASIGLVATCRSAWLVAEDAEVAGRRVLAQVKNNRAAPQPSLAFQVTRPEGGAPALHWLGPVAVTADDLLAPVRRPGPEAGPRDAACAFLRRVLAGGPVAAREVWKRAEQEGITFGTLKRAKKAVPVLTDWVPVNGLPISYWRLPGQHPSPDGVPAEESDPLFKRLRELEERHPSRSPLDDL
jgi:hypothetical protein